LVAGASIAVTRPSQDSADVQGQIERLLLRRGFRVMSDTAGSEYALSYSYAIRSGVGASGFFQNFAVTLVALNTGALVAAAVPEQRELTGKDIAKVLREFVDQLPVSKK
jgi:hypothetical protein